jgi:hypothetical protein
VVEGLLRGGPLGRVARQQPRQQVHALAAEPARFFASGFPAAGGVCADRRCGEEVGEAGARPAREGEATLGVGQATKRCPAAAVRRAQQAKNLEELVDFGAAREEDAPERHFGENATD